MNLELITIWKEQVDGQEPWHAKKTIYVAEFLYGGVQYNCQIHPWLTTEYGEYSEGGYVTGVTCYYTWEVEDITNITFCNDETDEYGDYLAPAHIKQLWMQELSEYMTEKELFTDED